MSNYDTFWCLAIFKCKVLAWKVQSTIQYNIVMNRRNGECEGWRGKTHCLEDWARNDPCKLLEALRSDSFDWTSPETHCMNGSERLVMHEGPRCQVGT